MYNKWQNRTLFLSGARQNHSIKLHSIKFTGRFLFFWAGRGYNHSFEKIVENLLSLGLGPYWVDGEDTKCVQNGTRKSSHFVPRNGLLVWHLKEQKPFVFLVFRANNDPLRGQVLAPERGPENIKKRDQKHVKFGAKMEPAQSFDTSPKQFSFGGWPWESFIQLNCFN